HAAMSPTLARNQATSTYDGTSSPMSASAQPKSPNRVGGRRVETAVMLTILTGPKPQVGRPRPTTCRAPALPRGRHFLRNERDRPKSSSRAARVRAKGPFARIHPLVSRAGSPAPLFGGSRFPLGARPEGACTGVVPVLAAVRPAGSWAVEKGGGLP